MSDKKYYTETVVREERLPTAEEFRKQFRHDHKYGIQPLHIHDICKIMIEFAQMHVTYAINAAQKSAKIIDDPTSYCGNTGSEYPPDQIVDIKAIASCYPIENIK